MNRQEVVSKPKIEMAVHQVLIHRSMEEKSYYRPDHIFKREQSSGRYFSLSSLFGGAQKITFSFYYSGAPKEMLLRDRKVPPIQDLKRRNKHLAELSLADPKRKRKKGKGSANIQVSVIFSTPILDQK